MPDDYQLESSLDFIDISSSLATKAKAKQLLQSVSSIKEKISRSIAHMKAATGQSIVETHRDLSPEQAHSFSIGLSFGQILQESSSWSFRRHLCLYSVSYTHLTLPTKRIV